MCSVPFLDSIAFLGREIAGPGSSCSGLLPLLGGVLKGEVLSTAD